MKRIQTNRAHQSLTLFTILLLLLFSVAADDEASASSSDASSCSASQDTTTCDLKKSALQTESPPTDSSGGFLIFALSMGRYGNQMEHLLGALAEARRHAPRRIVVLPSFIAWRYGRGRRNAHIPVEAAFDLDSLRRDFHPNIVSYAEFTNKIKTQDGSSTEWNAKEATIYCNSAYIQYPHFKCTPDFSEGTYWHSLDIEFAREQFYEQDIFDLSPIEHPVVIVSNALAAPFPMRPQDRYVAKYLTWTQRMEERRRSFLTTKGISNDDLVVAAHLRAGSDWTKACEHAFGNIVYMASPQCSEEMKLHNMTTIPLDVCLPTMNLGAVASDLMMAGQKMKEAKDGTETGRVVLFIATDVQGLGEKVWAEHNLGDTFDLLVRTEPAESNVATESDGIDAILEDSSFLDLIVMTYADYVLGNCVSSFTSFAARIRKEQSIGVSTEFFGLL